VAGRKGWLAAAGVAALVVVVVTVAAALALTGPGTGPRGSATGTVHVEPQVVFDLPPASAGCHSAVLTPSGLASVPMTVSTKAGQTAESISVCIDGQGPFPFVLDSGAGQSTIDAGLAHRLHLASAGAPTEFAGVGCTGTAQPVSVGKWSLSGIDLAPQVLTSATLPEIGGKGEPDGLLGSDVLARFGAVRLDFAAGVLVLPGPEGSALTGSEPYTGPEGAPPVLLTHGDGVTVPLTVTPTEGDVSLGVAVRFKDGRARSFVVDTGSSQSVLAASLARVERLVPTNLAQRQATVCSVITVPLVRSGSWSVPGVALTPQLLGKTNFGDISLGGVDGLLGSDQLRRYGWVVLDYSGGRMVLG
jgi:hypothetical protein